ncbi:Uncharacterized protein TCM_018991 [Theobroma cacao]|uniref:Uncharacterized protein n=1 Tax=Theobroma cacao TaxID=3641 RepID=A0A061EHC2_THECC|nr:Uncharacterized protein TCM_018991 [Theobroma cacao]
MGMGFVKCCAQLGSRGMVGMAGKLYVPPWCCPEVMAWASPSFLLRVPPFLVFAISPPSIFPCLMAVFIISPEITISAKFFVALPTNRS